jgi:hypothetical protein
MQRYFQTPVINPVIKKIPDAESAIQEAVLEINSFMAFNLLFGLAGCVSYLITGIT